MYARHIPGIWPARYFLASVRDFTPRSTLRVEKPKSRSEDCQLVVDSPFLCLSVSPGRCGSSLTACLACCKKAMMAPRGLVEDYRCYYPLTTVFKYAS